MSDTPLRIASFCLQHYKEVKKKLNERKIKNNNNMGNGDTCVCVIGL